MCFHVLMFTVMAPSLGDGGPPSNKPARGDGVSRGTSANVQDECDGHNRKRLVLPCCGVQEYG